MKATLHTNQGDIVVTLFPNEAPKTVENFVGLATGSRSTATTRAARTPRRSTTA